MCRGYVSSVEDGKAFAIVDSDSTRVAYLADMFGREAGLAFCLPALVPL